MGQDNVRAKVTDDIRQLLYDRSLNKDDLLVGTHKPNVGHS